MASRFFREEEDDVAPRTWLLPRLHATEPPGGCLYRRCRSAGTMEVDP